MKNETRKKTIDGVRANKRTRTSRSFVDSQESTNIPIKKVQQPTQQTRRVKKTRCIKANGLNAAQKKRSNLSKTQSNNDVPLVAASQARVANSRRRFEWIRRKKKIVAHAVRIFFVAILLVVFFNNRHSAEIRIRPHYEFLEINDSLNIYTNPLENQLGYDVIAVTDEVSMPLLAEEEVPVATKARVTVTVFNDFSSEPQRLIPTTRFESAGGKIFELGPSPIIIPAKTNQSPGSIEVEIIAQNPGSQYNIDITDFTIPGFKEAGLDNKFNGIYAVSKSAATGGDIGTKFVISDSQQEQAEIMLGEELTARLQKRLLKEKSDNLILVKNSEQFQLNESSFISDGEGSAGVLSKRGSIIASVISKDILGEFISDAYFDLPDGGSSQILALNDFVLEVSDPSTIDYESTEGIPIVVDGSPLMAQNIDIQDLKKQLSGYRERELNNFFDAKSSIDIAEVTIKPFWRKKLPVDTEQISITIK